MDEIRFALIWIAVVGVSAFAVAATAWGLVWKLLLRPIALDRGSIPMTAYDYVVRGWKAERRGNWDAALAAYDLAIETNPRYPEGRIRRQNLLANHPEFATDEPPRES